MRRYGKVGLKATGGFEREGGRRNGSFSAVEATLLRKVLEPQGSKAQERSDEQESFIWTALGGIIAGLLLLYLPDKDLDEIEKL
ncbi:MAG: hypothetical protein HYS74_02170 [Parcubacteria group bacterium]|nr:hypothetical protein [Parcubacteria group bacterium]